jgi:hypothetical protein
MSGKQSNQLCNIKYVSKMSVHTDIVDAMMGVFLPPAEYANLKKLCLKACLSGNHCGLFLALATNCKLNLIPHCNLKDTDFCCTIAGGHLVGGEMLFPQIDMALQYVVSPCLCSQLFQHLSPQIPAWKYLLLCQQLPLAHLCQLRARSDGTSSCSHTRTYCLGVVH